jgi:hypothetical protein
LAFRETHSGNGKPRDSQRLEVLLHASLRETGCSKFGIDIYDMSVTGCRLETSFRLDPETRVWITIPGLAALEAEIAWRNGYVYGCRFIQPLHVAVLDHVVRRYGFLQHSRKQTA